jgi:hypothetical protein
MNLILGFAIYLGTTIVLSSIAVWARTTKFAHIYAFFMALAGAYAIGFAIEIIFLQIDGYMPSPQPWPVVSWSVLGLTAFVIAGATTTSGLVNAIPCWIIAGLLMAHGVLQQDQVPVYAGAIMTAFGIVVLIVIPRLELGPTTIIRGPITDSEEVISILNNELAAEKEAQLERAKVVLRPLTFVAAVVAFSLSYWRYDLGLLLSIAAAVLTIPAMGLAVAYPIGYVLGKRAAQRFKRRVRDGDDYERRTDGTN